MFSGVLVTGASGFIASHIVLLLLKNGYTVRGTVRSLKNEKKLRPLKNICPEARNLLELVEADLLVADSWPKYGDKIIRHTVNMNKHSIQHSTVSTVCSMLYILYSILY